MRYQGATPGCMTSPSGNGKKVNGKLCKKEANHENGRILNTSHGFLEGKSVKLKGGLASSTSNNHHREMDFFNPTSDHSQSHEDEKCSKENHGSKKRVFEGDLVLQWGQNKRSRGYRAENSRNMVDEPPILPRKIIPIDKRSGRHEKQIPSAQTHSKSTPMRSFTPVRDAPAPGFSHRNSEDRSASGNCANHGINSFSTESRGCQRTAMHAPKSPEKVGKVVPGCQQTNCGLAIGNGTALESAPSETEAFAHQEKVNLDMFEWPRIYVSLSRKEKEDDFFVMKGTKLPQRPKKRAKNVDKILQYCFPGNWLSEINKARYEVREKKCIKKKPRGLKAMECLDSDSD